MVFYSLVVEDSVWYQDLRRLNIYAIKSIVFAFIPCQRRVLPHLDNQKNFGTKFQ